MTTPTPTPAAPRLAPGPKPTPLIGNVGQIQSLGLIGFAKQVWETYGDISTFRFGPMQAHMFVRPEHIQHILVDGTKNYIKGESHAKLRMWLGRGILTSEGEEWQRKRRLMAPIYTPTNIAHYANIMLDSARSVANRWLARSGQTINVNADMVRLTTSIISQAIFATDIVDAASRVDVALQTILAQSVKRMTSPIDLPLFVPTPDNLEYRWAVKTLDYFIYDIIQRRRTEPAGDDLLWLLINARDSVTGAGMDDKQLRDEVLVTFFAGHETTAQLLTWTWYLLAQNPAAAKQLHDELARVLNGRSPDMADLPNLPYTRMVLDETLRLYPPVAMFPRDVVADDEIGGYHIPAKTMVFLAPYMTHRHPDFWARPNEFYPQHFAPGEAEKRPRYAYYPFSAGPRTCIGNHFAMLEATLTLAELAQRLTLELPDDQPVEAEFVGTLRPLNATLKMRVLPR